MRSVSKRFTAASVALADEQGFPSLDDNVRKYNPELPDYGHAIAQRQMLHHTSGFRNFLTLLAFSGRNAADVRSEEELIDLLARRKDFNNIPGDEFIYSKTNYFLLGEVVKRATKESLAKCAVGNFFRPLAMVHTRYYDDHTVVLPGRVPAYGPGSDSNFLRDWSTDYDIVDACGTGGGARDLSRGPRIWNI
jgi:CubicO group peptidase (beta-lactamase class C family)